MQELGDRIASGDGVESIRTGSLTSNGFRIIDSRDLFAGENEIGIAHAGETYRLRITRQGKLILNK